MTIKKLNVLIIYTIITLLIFTTTYAHIVPSSVIKLDHKENILFLQVNVPYECKDSKCSEYSKFSYSLDIFNNNLTISQNNSKCNLSTKLYKKKDNLFYYAEEYYLYYYCPYNITEINIDNTLFYEKYGYYFEQYYHIQCSNELKSIYTDIIETKVTYNYKDLCKDVKNDSYINQSIINTIYNEFIYKNITNNSKNSTPNASQIAFTSHLLKENKNINNNENFFLKITSNITWLFNYVIELSKQKEFFILFLIFSFLLGVIHSFSPGHGKTLIVSYIIGHKASIKDIIKLSLTTATVHVLDVILLSLLFLFLPVSFKNSYIDIITIIAGTLIILLGIKFLIKSTIKKNEHTHEHTQEHTHEHSHEHTHEHTQEHMNKHTQEHTHEIKYKTITHHHDKENNTKNKKKNKRNIYAIGFLAGLSPCPTAWLLFSVLISLNLYLQAVISLIFFSIGLIFTIAIIAFLLFHSKKMLNKIPEEFKSYNYMKIISSCLIIIIGIIMIIRTIFK